eukprot:gene15760-9568_t
MGAPPPTPPPIERQRDVGVPARAGASSFVAPDAAARQLRRLAGVWFFRNHSTGSLWRYTVAEGGHTYTYVYDELGGDRRHGQKEFSFSPRGALCHAGRELKRMETTEDVVTGEAETVAAEWADGVLWVRYDPRDPFPAADSPPGTARSSPRRRRPSPGARVKFTVRMPAPAPQPAPAPERRREAQGAAATRGESRSERRSERPQDNPTSRGGGETEHLFAPVLIPLIITAESAPAARPRGPRLRRQRQRKTM